MTEVIKTVVQCDFDGTVTEEDGSFVLLDAFSGEDWRPLFRDYEAGRISVGQFNAAAFRNIKADRESLLEVVRREIRLKPGFALMVDCCRRKGFRFVIVSNGLRFYIDDILDNAGLNDIEVQAAETVFQPDGLRVYYMGPDGNRLDSDFKPAYADLFLSQGYRIIYLGNGASDVAPARKCHFVFATGSLVDYCGRQGIACTPFQDYNDVIPVLETL